MKVYFTASLTGKSVYLDNYLKIVGSLESLGASVVSSHIFDSTPEEVHAESRSERGKYLKYLNKWLGRCDLLVAETSYPSVSVGFEIAVALNRGKPVLVLYAEGASFPPVVAGFEGSGLLIEEYDIEDLPEILKYALEEVEQLGDKRFTMLMPRDILEFLDNQADGGVNKSEFIRNLIQEKMEEV